MSHKAEKFPDYAYAILPCSPTFYKLDMEVARPFKNDDLSLAAMVPEFSHDDEVACTKYCAYMAARLVMSRDFRNEEAYRSAVDLGCRPLILELASVFSRINPEFSQFEPFRADQESVGTFLRCPKKLEMSGEQWHMLCAAVFAQQLAASLQTAINKDSFYRASYPTFAQMLEAIAQEGLAADSIEERPKRSHVLECLDMGMNKLLLGLRPEVVLAIPAVSDQVAARRLDYQLASMAARNPWKEKLDMTRQRLFRDPKPSCPRFNKESTKVDGNVSAAIAEICVAMAFAEAVRNPLALVDFQAFLSGSVTKTRQTPTQRYFNEHPAGLDEWTGPCGRVVKAGKWSGSLPMCHTGSVGEARRADAADTNTAFKSMRLYARHLTLNHDKLYTNFEKAVLLRRPLPVPETPQNHHPITSLELHFERLFKAYEVSAVEKQGHFHCADVSLEEARETAISYVLLSCIPS